MGQNTVEFKLPNTNTVWTVEKAGPGDNGDYAEASAMYVGIGKAGELMVDAAKQLNGYTTEVEWDAHSLTTLETLSGGLLQGWSSRPPTAQDLMMAYDSGLIQGTPDQVKMNFRTTPPQVYVDRGYLGSISYSLDVVKVDMEDIKRVPPEYPNWTPSANDQGIYARPDGTYFSLFYRPSNPPQSPPPGQIAELDPNWDMKYTWQEWDIDWKNTTVDFATDFKKELVPTWIDSLGALKDDLTKQSPTQMAYLQNLTEQYDRMLAFLQGLLESLKKVLTGLINKQ